VGRAGRQLGRTRRCRGLLEKASKFRPSDAFIDVCLAHSIPPAPMARTQAFPFHNNAFKTEQNNPKSGYVLYTTVKFHVNSTINYLKTA
jgi:hypothetical protein